MLKLIWNIRYAQGVKASKLVASWGEFKADALSLETIAKQRKAALILLDKAQFDL